MSRGLRIIFLTSTWFVFSDLAWADGGAIRLSERHGQRIITIFSFPTPPRVGIVDISFLVQEADTGKPLLDLPIKILAYPPGSKSSSMAVPATAEGATNKLLYAGKLELNQDGKWQLEAQVDGEMVSFELEIAEALPAWVDMAPWLGWPVAAFGVFIIHRGLVHRYTRAAPYRNRSSAQGSPRR